MPIILMTAKFGSARKKGAGGHAAKVAVFFAAAWLFFVGAEYWVFDQIQRRIEVRISGTWVPSLWKPSFTVKQAAFEWKDRVRFLSGDVKVDYDPWDLWARRNFRIRLLSENAAIQFLGEWGQLQGGEKMTVDKLFADIALDTQGLKEIYAAEVKSPSYQFQIQHR